MIDDAIDEDSKGWALKVEVRRLNVSLSCSYSEKPTAFNRVVTEEMSRQTTMEEVIQRMKNLFEVPQDRKVRLFYKADNDRISPVSSSSTDTLNSTGYSTNEVSVALTLRSKKSSSSLFKPPVGLQVIILDVQDSAGSWTVDYT